MSFSLSNVNGIQMQRDSVLSSLSVACDATTVLPKNNLLYQAPRDGKVAVSVDVCNLEVANLQVSGTLTATNTQITNLFAVNGNIDTINARVATLKNSNAVPPNGGPTDPYLTIGGTAANDAVGSSAAIKIIGATSSGSAPSAGGDKAIDMEDGGNVSMQLQSAGTLKGPGNPTPTTTSDLSAYILSGADGQTPPIVPGTPYNADLVPVGGVGGVGATVDVVVSNGPPSIFPSGAVESITVVNTGVPNADFQVGQKYNVVDGGAILNNLQIVLGAGTVIPTGAQGGVLEVYEVKAQIFSGSVQGTPPVFNPGIAGLNQVTQGATFSTTPFFAATLVLEDAASPANAGFIAAAGNTTGLPNGSTNATTTLGDGINMLDPLFIQATGPTLAIPQHALTVNGGIQSSLQGGNYIFQVSAAGAIAALSAVLSGNLQVDGDTTLGDASTDSLTVNAASNFFANVTVSANLTVDNGGTTTLLDTNITGNLTQKGALAHLAVNGLTGGAIPNQVLIGESLLPAPIPAANLLTVNGFAQFLESLTVDKDLKVVEDSALSGAVLMSTNAIGNGVTIGPAGGGGATANAGDLRVNGATETIGLLTTTGGVEVSGGSLDVSTGISSNLNGPTTVLDTFTVGPGPLGFVNSEMNGPLVVFGSATVDKFQAGTLVNIATRFGVEVDGKTTVRNQTATTTAGPNAALVVSGGVGVAKNLYIDDTGTAAAVVSYFRAGDITSTGFHILGPGAGGNQGQTIVNNNNTWAVEPNNFATARTPGNSAFAVQGDVYIQGRLKVVGNIVLPINLIIDQATITNSTINSSIIGGAVPAAATFTNSTLGLANATSLALGGGLAAGTILTVGGKSQFESDVTILSGGSTALVIKDGPVATSEFNINQLTPNTTTLSAPALVGGTTNNITIEATTANSEVTINAGSGLNTAEVTLGGGLSQTVSISTPGGAIGLKCGQTINLTGQGGIELDTSSTNSTLKGEITETVGPLTIIAAGDPTAVPAFGPSFGPVTANAMNVVIDIGAPTGPIVGATNFDLLSMGSFFTTNGSNQLLFTLINSKIQANSRIIATYDSVSTAPPAGPFVPLFCVPVVSISAIQNNSCAISLCNAGSTSSGNVNLGRIHVAILNPL